MREELRGGLRPRRVEMEPSARVGNDIAHPDRTRLIPGEADVVLDPSERRRRIRRSRPCSGVLIKEPVLRGELAEGL